MKGADSEEQTISPDERIGPLRAKQYRGLCRRWSRHLAPCIGDGPWANIMRLLVWIFTRRVSRSRLLRQVT